MTALSRQDFIALYGCDVPTNRLGHFGPQERPGCGLAPSFPHGLTSLWDMINGHISSLCELIAQLRLYQLALGGQQPDPGSADHAIDPRTLASLRGWLGIARQVASDFELKEASRFVNAIEKDIEKRSASNTFRYRDVSTHAGALLLLFQEGVKDQLVYRYPDAKAQVLSRWKDDWAAVCAKFPSAENDIVAGVDLWALGHGTASVFQFMRVLEHGLRALAADVGKTFDIQNWQNIIDEIESAIRLQMKALPRGAEKNDRLQFLSEAAKEFSYFKDGWRNHVSHGRGAYDEHQARSVMEHVRTFMTHLASSLGEDRDQWRST